MDLINELEIMKADGLDNAISYVKEHKKIWEKKLHILNVINVVDELQKLAQDNFFSDNGITKLRLYTILHYTGNSIKFEACDDFYKKINLGGSYDTLENIFLDFEGIHFENIHSKFDFHMAVKGDVQAVKDNIKLQIFDMFLSDELKKVFEYSQMNINIPQKEDGNNLKRPKL